MVNLSPLFAVCADGNALGRFDRSMLSDHQMMELLFTPGDAEVARESLGGSEDDACTWKGVHCNAAQRVEKILWSEVDVAVDGVIDFTMFPPGLRELHFYAQMLCGEVNLTSLPARMESLDVVYCLFTGTLDLGHLPRGLTKLIFTHHQTSAVVNLRNLPAALERFVINEPANRSESTHVGKLPEGDFVVDVRGCNFRSVTYEDMRDKGRVWT